MYNRSLATGFNVLVLFFLWSCSVDGKQKNSTAESAAMNQAIYGVEVLGKEVIFRVPSGGCTAKEHFKVEKLSDGAILKLVRIKPDYCKALFIEGVKIAYSFEELGLAEGAAITIANPVSKSASSR